MPTYNYDIDYIAAAHQRVKQILGVKSYRLTLVNGLIVSVHVEQPLTQEEQTTLGNLLTAVVKEHIEERVR